MKQVCIELNEENKYSDPALTHEWSYFESKTDGEFFIKCRCYKCRKIVPLPEYFSYGGTIKHLQSFYLKYKMDQAVSQINELKKELKFWQLLGFYWLKVKYLFRAKVFGLFGFGHKLPNDAVSVYRDLGVSYNPGYSFDSPASDLFFDLYNAPNKEERQKIIDQAKKDLSIYVENVGSSIRPYYIKTK